MQGIKEKKEKIICQLSLKVTVIYKSKTVSNIMKVFGATATW